MLPSNEPKRVSMATRNMYVNSNNIKPSMRRLLARASVEISKYRFININDVTHQFRFETDLVT